jgi:rfaE bifunctional protein nucleotidyltransferase chain/domain
VRDPAEKILPRNELAERLARRPAGQRVVLANGIFDVLHVGHLRYLEAARAAGEVLAVAINDDASARRAKGPGRPLVPEAERALALAAFRCVDWVSLFSEPEVAETIRVLRPDLHAKGTDYRPETIPEAERRALEEVGGRAIIAGDPKSHATRDLIATVRSRYR